MHDRNLDEYTRHEKLKYEINKLDDEAEKKYMRGNDIEAINESALIMMNAIEAKMALLGVDTGKSSWQIQRNDYHFFFSLLYKNIILC